MPIKTDIQGTEAIYNQGVWSCEDSLILEILTRITETVPRPHDPEGVEPVTKALSFLGGTIVEVWASEDWPEDRIY